MAPTTVARPERSGATAGFVGVWLMIAAGLAWGQSPSQIQYIYDAAGNLIQVTRSAVTLQPDLTVSNLSVGTISRNSNASFNIPLTFQVNNIGGGTATATWYDRGYLSPNTLLHDADQALGGYNTRSTNLAAAGSYTVSATFTTSTTIAPGNYYLIVKTDGGAAASGQYSSTGPNNVAELNENNNTQVVSVNLPANLQPDLTVSNASIGAITVNQNGSYKLPVTYTVNNVGLNGASAGWYDAAYLSADATLDNADQNLSGSNHRGTPLEPGTSYTTTVNFTTTTATGPGTYTLFIKADGHGAAIGTGGTNTDNGAVTESNETNNTQALALTLLSKPDLTASNLTIGTIASKSGGGYSIPVTFTVTNLGGSAATATWYDYGYLSLDATLDNNDQVLGGYNTRSANLAGGANYVVNTTLTTSATTAAGNYTLFVKADGGWTTSGAYAITGAGYVTETNEANNVASAAVALNTDLAVSGLTVGTITPKTGGGYNIPVTFTVTNVGTSTATATWYDYGYLSTDAALDNNDQVLGGYNIRSTNLAGGASYVVNKTLTTNTTTAAGNYTLFVKADGGWMTSGAYAITGPGYVTEASESNNVASAAVVLP